MNQRTETAADGVNGLPIPSAETALQMTLQTETASGGSPSDTETADDLPSPADTESADAESADAESADAESADTETADTESADAETADTETADAETADDLPPPSNTYSAGDVPPPAVDDLPPEDIDHDDGDEGVDHIRIHRRVDGPRRHERQR